MSWFKVVQGIYYFVSGTDILKNWLDDNYDIAQREIPNATSVKGDTDEGYGFLGFQAGLHSDQKVDEVFWGTRIPFEFHFRRKRNPHNRSSEIPKNVEWHLHIDWFHIGEPTVQGALHPVNKIKEDSIRFQAKDDFYEVTIDQVYDENDTGGEFVVLSDTRSAYNENEILGVAPGHPKYFTLIQPPTNIVSFASPLRLSWQAYIVPGAGLTRKSLAMWFDPDRPKEVKFIVRPERINDYQQIDYDYFVY